MEGVTRPLIFRNLVCIFGYFLRGQDDVVMTQRKEEQGNNRSVMPLDALGGTRTTMLLAASQNSSDPAPKRRR